MWKSRLQEFSQRNYRSLPAYTHTKHGADHTPLFSATVSLHGLTFQSPTSLCTTAKQAENAAAQAALSALLHHTPHQTIQTQSAKVSSGSPERVSTSEPDISLEVKEETTQMAEASCQSFPTSATHVVPPAGVGVKDDSIKPMPGISEKETNNEHGNHTAARMQAKSQPNEGIRLEERETWAPQFLSGLYKNQLQDFAQRGGFELPCYSHIQEGPSHVPRFNATVTFIGATFKSPGLFNTLREAEHAVAAVVLKSLSEKGSSLDESFMYKNLLQEKALKERRPLPVYNTTKSGPSHMPFFTCTVKFDDMTFVGEARKKKQAEKNAASAAWSALKDARRSVASTPLMPEYKVKAPAYEPNCHSNVGVKTKMKKECKSESHDQQSHLDPSASLPEISHSETSEAFGTGYKNELVEYRTSIVPENPDEDTVQQPCNTVSPTKVPSGTRIQVVPASEAFKRTWSPGDFSSSRNPWVAFNLPANDMQSQDHSL